MVPNTPDFLLRALASAAARPRCRDKDRHRNMRLVHFSSSLQCRRLTKNSDKSGPFIRHEVVRDECVSRGR